MSNIFGVDCGLVKLNGKMVSKVFAKNGNDSELYKSLLDHIKELPIEEKEELREQYRSWSEEGIIGDVDNDKHLALGMYGQTTSENFKKWFGDSKVVDSNGEPLIVYHGTGKDFDSFKKGNFNNKESGIFFSKSKNYANSIGVEFSSKGSNIQVKPVFLSIKNPEIIPEELRDEIEITHDFVSTMLESEHWKKRNKNTDGFVGRDFAQNENDETYVVFESNQIKSVFNKGEYSEQSDNIYHQAQGDTTSSKASPETVKQFTDWFKNTGVDFKTVTDGIRNEKGELLKVNESVDVMNGIIRVVEGQENRSIPEAGMHIAARIVKEHNPKLFKEMMQRIGTYKLFDRVVQDYKGFKNYQLPDGKPDIAKLKEETIGKVLAEYYIGQQEGEVEKPELLERVQQVQSWWNRIKESLRDFFKGNPFTKVTKDFSEKKENFKFDNIKKIKNNDFGNVSTNSSKEKGNVIEAVSNFFRGIKTTIPISKPGREEVSYEQREEEELALIDYVRKNNLLVPDIFTHHFYFDAGGESIVYKLRPDTVTKLNSSKLYPTWKDFFDSLLIHNELFPDMEYKLKGFTDHNGIRAVLEQPFVKGSEASPKEISDYLSKLGFKEDYSNDTQIDYITKDGKIELSDLHRGNIVKVNNELYFIDTQFFLTSKFYESEFNADDTFFQVSSDDKQEKLFNEIIEKAKTIGKQTDANGNSSYLIKGSDGKSFKPEYRPSDYGKHIYKSHLGEHEDTLHDKTIRDTGTRLHSYNDDIMNRYIDPITGKRRDTIEVNRGTISPGEEAIYNQLEKYIGQVLDKYPDAKFLHEIPVYKAGVTAKPGKGDIAGTLDFMAIMPDGGIHIRDWKFMEAKEREDVSLTTQQAHRAQLKEYGQIMRLGYGVENIYENDSIPIKMHFGKGDNSELLQTITLGSSDVTEINDNTLLPITGAVQKIKGNPELSSLIDSFQNQITTLFEQRGITGEQKKQNQQKAQELSLAIRNLTLKGDIHGLVNYAFTETKAYFRELKEVKKFIENSTESNINPEEAARVLDNLSNSLSQIANMKDLRVVLDEQIKSLPEDEQKPMEELLNRLGNNIVEAEKEFHDTRSNTGTLVNGLEKIVNAVGIYNIASMDRNLSVWQQNFTHFSNTPIRTGQALYKFASQGRHDAELQAVDMAKQIEHHKDKLLEMFGGAWDNKRLIEMLFKKGKDGKWTPKLISKTSKDFYEKLDTELRKGDSKRDYAWIRSHVDMKAYKQWFDEGLTSKIESSKHTVFDINSYREDVSERAGTLDQERREKSIEGFKRQYDPEFDSAYSPNNWMLKKFPVDSDNTWSDEYKSLKQPQHKAALGFYDYLGELNLRAHNSGMLGDFYKSFFPQLRKQSVVHLLDGEFKRFGRSFISSFVKEEGERRFRDSNGKVQNSIRGKFTYDLGVDGDYIDVSEDIMKSATMYASEIAAYENLDKVESIAKALYTLERAKKVLKFNKGKVVLDVTGKPVGDDNRKNVAELERIINHAFYGEKSKDHLSEWTVTIDGKEHQVDFAKALDSTVNAITLKSLGLNPLTAMSNIMGGAMNIYIMSDNKYFSKQDYYRSFHNILGAKFHSEEGKKFLSLMDHFAPMTESIQQHLGKEASQKDKVVNWLSGEGLMVLMRKSDNLIQMINSSVFFQNTMLENGELINIRDFVKRKPEYQNIYDKTVSPEQRKSLYKKMNSEIEELQKTRNLYNDKTIKFNDNNFDIDWGIDKKRLGKSEFKLREQIQNLTRDALGNRTADEMAGINNLMFGTALMQFRNWIPRLAQKRFGEFKYHTGWDQYEIGRVRMVGDVISDRVNSKVKNITSMISSAHGGSGETNIIEIAKRQYQRRLEEARLIEGNNSMFEQKTTEADFVEMYVNGIRSQVRELEMTVALMAMFFGALHYAQSLPKDDDNYPERGAWKYAVKSLDKFSDELGFFYSPSSFQTIIGSGNILPLLGVVKDIGNFSSHLANEGYYLYTGNDEKEQKNKVLKYPVNYVPVLNQISSYFGILNKDWADIMGYTPQYRYGGNTGR